MKNGYVLKDTNLNFKKKMIWFLEKISTYQIAETKTEVMA